MMTDSDASTMPDPAEQTVIEETEAMLDDSVAQFRLMHTETVTAEDEAVPKFNFEDDKFILRFLRAMKFETARAVELYKKYNLKRHSIWGDTQGKLSFNDPSFKKVVLDQPMVLPHNAKGERVEDNWGRKVLFFRPRNIDYSKINPQDMLKHVWVIMDQQLEDEDTQRKGLIILNNAEGMSRKNFSRETVKLILDSIQNAIPVRMGGLYICNAGIMFGIIFPIIKVFMSSKLRKRFVSIGTKVETLKSLFPTTSIPTELGGELLWTQEDHYKWLAQNGMSNVPGVNDAGGSAQAAAPAPKVVAL